MNIIDAINTRRSIRKFTGQVISEDQLKVILKAGFQAPSAHNFQPRDFVVVRDKDKLETITNSHKYAKMLPSAGCGIIVCGDTVKQREIGFLIEDCSSSIQNMLLAAHGLGLGAVWCGIYSKEELIDNISKILQLPKHILPIGMVVVGNKDEEKLEEDRYNEERIHHDFW